MVGFELLNYQVLEPDLSVLVCIVIEEGILDVNINPAVTESTVDGTAVGKTPRNVTSSSLTTHYVHAMLSLSAPADYGAIIGNTFELLVGDSPGDQFCETVTIVDDDFSEGNEQFTMTLASLSALVIVNPLRNVATIDIIDDDSMPIIVIIS